MLAVKCPCGAVTKMQIMAGQFFHLGSGKESMGKYFINNEPHKPICLWCGFEFEKINELLGAKETEKK